MVDWCGPWRSTAGIGRGRSHRTEDSRWTVEHPETVRRWWVVGISDPVVSWASVTKQVTALAVWGGGGGAHCSR